MIIIVYLLCVSLVVAIFFLIAFVWGVKSGQFEDDYSPAHRIFYEDRISKKDIPVKKENTVAKEPVSQKEKTTTQDK